MALLEIILLFGKTYRKLNFFIVVMKVLMFFVGSWWMERISLE